MDTPGEASAETGEDREATCLSFSNASAFKLFLSSDPEERECEMCQSCGLKQEFALNFSQTYHLNVAQLWTSSLYKP